MQDASTLFTKAHTTTVKIQSPMDGRNKWKWPNMRNAETSGTLTLHEKHVGTTVRVVDLRKINPKCWEEPISPTTLNKILRVLLKFVTKKDWDDILNHPDMAKMLGTGKKSNSHKRHFARVYEEAPDDATSLPSLTTSFFKEPLGGDGEGTD